MDTKLTLSIDPEIVLEAKKLAASEGKSLSSIVEAMLKGLIELKQSNMKKQKTKSKLKGEIAKLGGSIKLPSKSKDKDYKYDYLMEKYS